MPAQISPKFLEVEYLTYQNLDSVQAGSNQPNQTKLVPLADGGTTSPSLNVEGTGFYSALTDPDDGVEGLLSPNINTTAFSASGVVEVLGIASGTNGDVAINLKIHTFDPATSTSTGVVVATLSEEAVSLSEKLYFSLERVVEATENTIFSLEIATNNTTVEVRNLGINLLRMG